MNYIAIIIFVALIAAGAKILVNSQNKKQAAEDEAHMQAAAARDEACGDLFLQVSKPLGNNVDSEYGTIQMKMGTRKMIPVFFIVVSLVALYCIIFNGDNTLSTNIGAGIIVGIIDLVCIVFMFQSVSFFQNGVLVDNLIIKKRFTYNDIINISKTNTSVNNSSGYPTYIFSLKNGKKVSISGLVFSHVDWHIDQMQSNLNSSK